MFSLMSRDDGGYRTLQVPFLAEDVRMEWHILFLHLKLHGQRANLDHLADIQADGKCNLVAALVRVPVDQHVR
jgi:hypothetical protein